jgi:hypothetical protein
MIVRDADFESVRNGRFWDERIHLSRTLELTGAARIHTTDIAGSTMKRMLSPRPVE